MRFYMWYDRYAGIWFSETCDHVMFVDDMNDTLFRQIDTIVDYNLNTETSGHMIWFSIDGRNYYCFQPEGRQLSDEVWLALKVINNYLP